ncbi:type IV conjugative transfer system coupling TraD domain protein [Escherichia coli DEC7C]|nr:type IV conjugative transfer system coupling TraD domain protein [Escherichia coli DEC7C]
MLKQELIIAGCAALLVAFVATFAAYWYLGRTGRQQSEDEIIGGAPSVSHQKKSQG